MNQVRSHAGLRQPREATTASIMLVLTLLLSLLLLGTQAWAADPAIYDQMAVDGRRTSTNVSAGENTNIAITAADLEFGIGAAQSPISAALTMTVDKLSPPRPFKRAGLARTGASTSQLVIVVTGLVTIGAALLLPRRRKR